MREREREREKEREREREREKERTEKKRGNGGRGGGGGASERDCWRGKRSRETCQIANVIFKQNFQLKKSKVLS